MAKLIFVFLFVVSRLTFAFGQDRKPMTLEEVIYLVRAKVSPARIVELIEKHGVGFEVDEGVLSKLKQAGANEAVLSAARKEGQKYKEAGQRKRELEEVRKRVEAAKRLEEARKREEEATRQAEAERRRQEEAKRKEEEKRKAEEEARRKKKEEAARLAEAQRKEEAKRQEEAKKREEARKRELEEARRREEEARQAEEAKKKEADEAKRRQQEAARRAEVAKTGIAPAPPCVVGLRLRFQYVDGGNFTRAITSRQGDMCVIGSTSRSYYDKDWVLVKQVDRDGNEITSWRPLNPLVGQKWLDFPLSVGKTWETRFTSTGGSYINYFTVLSYEEVTVPAGTFKAFKIQEHQMAARGSYGVRYFWYAPEVGYYVKRQWAPDESSSPYYWQSVRDYELVSVSGLK